MGKENAKSPTQQWKEIHDKYFYEVESVDKEDNASDVLFSHLPRFSRNNGFWSLAIIAVGMMAASYYLCASCKDVAGSGGWMSNLLLNLAMGVIAGFVVFFYTTRRDRVMMGFSEVVVIMKQRLTLFKSLVGDDGAISKIDPSFLFQTQSDCPLTGIDSLSANNEFNSVLVNYFKYLEKHLMPVFQEYDFAGVVAELDRRNKEEFKSIDALHRRLKENEKLDEELKNDCCRNVYETTRLIISSLEKLYYKLHASVYGVKFGRPRRLWRHNMLHKIGWGGSINTEIIKEGMLHGVFSEKRLTNAKESTKA